ncbi:zinc finger BED domain-containing protein RICESLEEPER 2-like protein, partial [Tanacetum coccineum]
DVSSHILNLIVQDGLAVIVDGIDRIRDIDAFWTTTPKREQKFEEAARQLEISSTKKLTLDYVFKRLKARDSQYKCLPKERDWELAMEVCDRLQVFYEITLTFSGSKYPTTNLFFVSVCEIGYCLREWASSSVEVIQKMASKMLEKFNKYWSVISGVMGMAAVLDPRYKMKFLKLLLPKIYGQEKASNEILTLQEFVKSLFKGDSLDIDAGIEGVAFEFLSEGIKEDGKYFCPAKSSF